MIQFRTLDIDGLWAKIDSRNFELSRLVHRTEVENIKHRFDSDNIEIIIGPRQSGKTTGLMMLINDLINRGIAPQKILYINMDTIDEFDQFKSPMMLVEQINHVRKKGERVYFFIDEVQRLETPGRFLKGVYDLDKNIKIFATGSSSLEINSKIKEFLTGRKRETYIFPISFKEYIRSQGRIPNGLKTIPLNKASLNQWVQNEKAYGSYLTRVMEEMSLYGGYPAVIMAKNHDMKVDELKEIYQSYIKKDIIEFLKLGKAQTFINLIKALSSQTGNLINKSEICSLTGSNSVTITKYMNILKETFVADFLPPFVGNRRNEIKSAHKSYFIDNGLRNFVIRQFSNYNLRPDKGSVTENLIFSEFVKDGTLLNEELFYWRTKSGAEMDFVLRPGTNVVVPIEIKTSTARPRLLTKSFHSFLNSFSPTKAILLNRDLFHIEKIKQTKVYYIPIHWFLLYGLKLIV